MTELTNSVLIDRAAFVKNLQEEFEMDVMQLAYDPDYDDLVEWYFDGADLIVTFSSFPEQDCRNIDYYTIRISDL